MSDDRNLPSVEARGNRLLVRAALSELALGSVAGIVSFVRGDNIAAVIVIVAVLAFALLALLAAQSRKSGGAFVALSAVGQIYTLVLLGYSLVVIIDFYVVQGGWSALLLFGLIASTLPPVVGVFAFASLRRYAERGGSSGGQNKGHP